MKNESKVVIVLGFVVAITPFLGIPINAKLILITIFGVLVSAYTYWSEKHIKECEECKDEKSESNNVSDAFIENDSFKETQEVLSPNPSNEIKADDSDDIKDNDNND